MNVNTDNVPGGNADVAAIKAQFADVVDDLNDRCIASTSAHAQARYRRAIDKLEEAQMLAVKAAPWAF